MIGLTVLTVMSIIGLMLIRVDTNVVYAMTNGRQGTPGSRGLMGAMGDTGATGSAGASGTDASIDPFSRTLYVDGSSTVPGTPDGSVAHPFLLIQDALDAVGPAADRAAFNDATLRAWKLVIEPGQYVEDLFIPIRADWTFEVNGVVILGTVTYTFDWSQYGTASPTALLQQLKLKFVGGDLRSAFQAQTGPTPQMPINGISGNLIVRPINTSGLTAVFQVHLINFGVTGTPTGVGAGTGHIILDGNTSTLQLFADNAIVTGDFYMTPIGVGVLQGTLYLSNSDTSGTASFGGTFGRVALNVLRNVRFTRVVSTSGVPGRWTNVVFANVANDFTGAVGACAADNNSFNSFFVNVPTKGGVTFTMIDNIQGSTAQRPTTQLAAASTNGVMYWDSTLARPIWRDSTSATGWSFADGTDA